MAEQLCGHSWYSSRETASFDVPWEVIKALSATTRKDELDIVPPVSIEVAEPVAATVTVHVHKIYDRKAKVHRIRIDWTGLPSYGDLEAKSEVVGLKLTVSRRLRNWLDVSDEMQVFPYETDLNFDFQGNGEGPSFVFGHTSRLLVNARVKLLKFPCQKLRKMGALCDVVLHAANTDFPAHKVILAAGSDVFMNMFTGSFVEAKDKLVRIEGVSNAVAFEKLLEFLYIGFVSSWMDQEIDILELADRFLVGRLKEFCEQRLLRVKTDGALELLQTSLEKPFISKAVRRKAMKVVKEDWAYLVDTPEWKEFQVANPSIALLLEAGVDV